MSVLTRSGAWSMGLRPEEWTVLLGLARDTLTWAVGDRRSPFAFAAYPLSEPLRQPRGTFVTLTLDGGLRGCIGALAPGVALYLSVHRNTLAAAMEDNRFVPVAVGEAARLRIRVAVLSPLQPLPRLEDFRPGEQGLILQRGVARAVFLPEVAAEQGWDAHQTAKHLSMKAGLSADAWKHGATFEVFWTESIREDGILA